MENKKPSLKNLKNVIDVKIKLKNKNTEKQLI